MKALRDRRGGPVLDWHDPLQVRAALLQFIGDFADWGASLDKDLLRVSRSLVLVAHESLGGESGARPLVIDPFCGGGAIPFEAVRVGADAFASDLNPIPVLLNRVLLEYVPRFGAQLAAEVERWGNWIADEAGNALASAYPRDPDGATPICYVWARTVLSEEPSGREAPVEIPLIRSMWLAKKKGRYRALRWRRGADGKVITKAEVVRYADGRELRVRRPLLEVFEPKAEREVEKGTSAGGAATCPVSGHTTTVESVRAQLSTRRGGASDARLVCVVTTKEGEQGRRFRDPAKNDAIASAWAADALRREVERHDGTAVPDEELNHIRGFFNVPLYGMSRWGDLFSPRQQLSLITLARLVRKAGELAEKDGGRELGVAVQTCLALALGKQADSNSSLCAWRPTSLDIGHTFGRQALPMMWDFAEANVVSRSTRDWSNAVEGGLKALTSIDDEVKGGQAAQASATQHPLPDDSADAFVTDPPYYSAVPYADLSDFFYVWLRKAIGDRHPDLFRDRTTPKSQEIVSLAHRAAMYREKDTAWFEARMGQACAEGRRVLRPGGVGVVVFASKETAAWQAMLGALIGSGWVVTASWPIDTEMSTRLRARNSATLASSIHIVCRPRESSPGAARASGVGDWRDVLEQLPTRIHEWMPRLSEEGIVGADAIFACLGPALEIFSRYERVEKLSGERVFLDEYLEHVWAAVSREALAMIFEGAETVGLEPDARVTAMWLWTLATPGRSADQEVPSGSDEDLEEDESVSGAPGGWVIEFDTARKIAQGLGARLEELADVVEVKGDKGRLLPVKERAPRLFGNAKSATESPPKARGRKQMKLFVETSDDTGPQDGGELGSPNPESTTLDRIHQAMLLFGSGRGEALKRFLVEDGIGKDAQFWRLAQSLSALYPPGSDEKRWVDGVLARKKGLGFG
jgi:adenine-specific DNA methylase